MIAGTTAFFFYLKHNRDDINKKHPDLKVQDVAKVAGIDWGKMTDKSQAKYIAMAEEDRSRYMTEMESYVPPAKVLIMGKRKLSEKQLAKKRAQV